MATFNPYGNQYKTEIDERNKTYTGSYDEIDLITFVFEQLLQMDVHWQSNLFFGNKLLNTTSVTQSTIKRTLKYIKGK